jgi:hypothetical protein
MAEADELPSDNSAPGNTSGKTRKSDSKAPSSANTPKKTKPRGYKGEMVTDFMYNFPARAAMGAGYLYYQLAQHWERADSFNYRFIANQMSKHRWDIVVEGGGYDFNSDHSGVTKLVTPVRNNLSKNGAQQMLYAFQEEGSRIARYNSFVNLGPDFKYCDRLPARMPRRRRKIEEGIYDFDAWNEKIKANSAAIFDFPVPYIVTTKQLLDMDAMTLDIMRGREGEDMVDQDDINDDIEEGDVAMLMQPYNEKALVKGLDGYLKEKILERADKYIQKPKQFFLLYDPVTSMNMYDMYLDDAKDEKDKGIHREIVEAKCNSDITQHAWCLGHMERGTMVYDMRFKYFENALHMIGNCYNAFLKNPIAEDFHHQFIDHMYAFDWEKFKPFAKAFDIAHTKDFPQRVKAPAPPPTDPANPGTGPV